jgi:23S rRNA (cytidine1920-2'-O)/16S rRNA (cytidine1409-2'-O)-methyltransferase
MEGTNARFVPALPEAVSLVTIDASFISLKTLLPVVRGWLALHEGEVVALIKPQFEVERKQAARHKGVIRDRGLHRRVLLDVLAFAQQDGYIVNGLIRSPLFGPKGNAEFLAHLLREGQPGPDIEGLVSAALQEAEAPRDLTAPEAAP